VKLFQQQHYGNRVIASELANPDFVKLAESFGVTGLRAPTPAVLEEAVAGALQAERPVLIEVPMGEVPDPWPLARPAQIRGL
jgi:acetolactate synthase-1/2/3 large subunit